MASMCCPNGGCVLKYLRAGSWESWAAGPAQHQLHHWIPQACLCFPLYKVRKAHLVRACIPLHAFHVSLGLLHGCCQGCRKAQNGRQGRCQMSPAWHPHPQIYLKRSPHLSHLYIKVEQRQHLKKRHTVRKMGASRLWLGLQCSWTPTLSWSLEDFPAFVVAGISAKVGIHDLDISSFFSLWLSLLYPEQSCCPSLSQKWDENIHQRCVLKSTFHKESKRSMELACLQGTWHQLALALSEQLYTRAFESEVRYLGLFAWVLLGIFFHMRKRFIVVLSSAWHAADTRASVWHRRYLSGRCVCMCVCYIAWERDCKFSLLLEIRRSGGGKQ